MPCIKTRILAQQLRNSVLLHILEIFVEPLEPLSPHTQENNIVFEFYIKYGCFCIMFLEQFHVWVPYSTFKCLCNRKIKLILHAMAMFSVFILWRDLTPFLSIGTLLIPPGCSLIFQLENMKGTCSLRELGWGILPDWGWQLHIT